MLAFGPANIRLFAINSIVALVCATFTGLIIAPSLYIPFKKKADKKQAERARYDYKKEKKSEKTEQ
jgi:preprotein translocase subunit SecF